MKFRYSIALIISLVLLAHAVYASHEVEYRFPRSMITTVGKFTAVQIDIQNIGSVAQSFRITMTATPPNEMEITNPNINTPTLRPGQATSVYSNIRTLTGNPKVLTIQIHLGAALLHTEAISVQAKKFSLPEFGLFGFLQILAMAAVVYFLFIGRMANRRR